jgi:hypothetical protein
MSKPKGCIFLNVGRTSGTAMKCVQGECQMWDEEMQDCGLKVGKGIRYANGKRKI